MKKHLAFMFISGFLFLSLNGCPTDTVAPKWWLDVDGWEIDLGEFAPQKPDGNYEEQDILISEFEEEYYDVINFEEEFIETAPDIQENDFSAPDEIEQIKDTKPADGPLDVIWTPDWVSNPDPITEGCLATLPLICYKVDECFGMIPFLSLGKRCANGMDMIAPLLVMGCDQIAKFIEQQTGQIMGGDLIASLLASMIQGCINNFQCDLQYALQVGQDIWAILQAAQGGDYMAALPSVLNLLKNCSGIELPFF
jgi:hypothetical protein